MRSGHAPGMPCHRNLSSLPGFPPSNTRMHKQTLSLSNSNGFPKAPTSGVRDGVPGKTKGGDNKHRRSVSIVSLGGDAVDEGLSRSPQLSSQLPARGHTRSASLQVLPRRTAVLSGSLSPGRQAIIYNEVHANDPVRDSK